MQFSCSIATVPSIVSPFPVGDTSSQDDRTASSPIKGAPVAVEEIPEMQLCVETPPKQKPRKLVSLMYNYSDSEDGETRDERKARIVSLSFTVASLIML